MLFNYCQTMSLIEFNEEFKTEFNFNSIYESGYEKLYDYQQFSIENLIKGNDNLSILPTGSGKTLIALYGIINVIRNKKIAIYTAPTKALVNQTYRILTNILSKLKKNETDYITVGILTGDIKRNIESDCLVVTTEILKNSYTQSKTDEYKSHFYISEHSLDNLGFVVFDEIHYIYDVNRGKVWANLISNLNTDIQICGLTATLENYTQLLKLFKEKKRNLSFIKKTKRNVPLLNYILVNDHLIEIYNKSVIVENYETSKSEYNPKKKQYNTLNSATLVLKKKKMFPSIFFTLSQFKCEQFAKMINLSVVEKEESDEIVRICNYYLGKFDSKYNYLKYYRDFISFIKYGIAFHHAGMLQIMKEIVEILFTKGLIKILFATETFSVGLNMPTKTVVFAGLKKYTDKSYRYLNNDEFKQMSGRAGRKGFDKYGNTIILPIYEFPKLSTLQNMYSGKEIIKKFTCDLDYNFVTNIIINGIEKMFKNSLFDLEINSNVKLLEKELEKSENQLNEKLENTNIKFEELKEYYNSVIENEKYEKYMKFYKEFVKIKNKYEYNKNFIVLETQKYLNVLYKFNYIKNPIITSNLTIKGIFINKIHIANPILLSELLFSDFFENIETTKILVCVLGYILKNNTNENEDYIEYIDYQTFDYLKIINSISSDIIMCEIDNEVHSNGWTFDYKNVVLVDYWIHNEDNNFDFIHECETNIGSFTKIINNIIRLSENIIELLTLINKEHLIQYFTEVINMINKLFVSNESLYV